MSTVECKYWEDCGVGFGGCCSVGVFNRPSFGVCNNACKYNTANKEHEPIEGFTKISTESGKKPPLHKRIIGNVMAYIEAEASLANYGELDDEQFNARIELCLSCDELKQTYDKVGHCGACGCGISKRASLTVKGRMPLSTCPKNKWAKVELKAIEE